VSATPSLVFKTILPINPSVIITFTSPLKISPPSTLPTKLGRFSFKSLKVSLVIAFPLLSSSPLLKRPIVTLFLKEK